MLRGFDKNGNMRNVIVKDDGSIPVSFAENSGELNSKETVLNASILTVSTEAQTVEVNKKVTAISIANYSESADVTMSIGEKQYIVGANLAIDYPINLTVNTVSLVSTEDNTKVQLVIKGVE